MNLMIIMAYGIYAMLVGMNWNGRKLIEEFDKDVGGFLPWAISIGVLAVIWEIPATKKLAAPFLMLAVLTFVLRNFDTLKAQFNSLSQEAKS